MLHKVVLRDANTGEWLVFMQPDEVLVARKLADVRKVLRTAEQFVEDEKRYAAGWVSYEAAPAFDPALVTLPQGALPLVCLGIFREPERIAGWPRPAAGTSYDWHFSGSRANYLETIAAIKLEIEAGNTYQVNYTTRQQARDVRDPWGLFLATATDAPYGAYIEGTEFAIVSGSPELFFELDVTGLRCKPMKGTAARGMTTAEDRDKKQRLYESLKERAENVMIADMVRNDLGRIAHSGSVKASTLYDIEKYRTVWQMTSTINASTTASVPEIFGALFPSASVTGAPKVASMKLIASLEDSPRQVYTGAIGYMAPQRRACFSVAIRTVLVDRTSHTAVYGVGGGIVWDSQPEAEFQECMDKARVLASAVPDNEFSLLETMLWDAGKGFVLLDEHLDRLEASAEYFDFVLHRVEVGRRLAALEDALDPAQPHRVRLMIERDGAIHLETQTIPAIPGCRRIRLALAASPIDKRDPFLYHKTTRREVYEKALDKALEKAGDCDDVLLWNEDGHITESGIANVVVRLGGKLYTPPVSCGLLAGTYRHRLLREGVVEEKAIRVPELDGAEAIHLVNSVRGWISCELLSSGKGVQQAAR